MKRLRCMTVLASLMATGFYPGNLAYAVSPNFPGAPVAKINGQGFETCKSLNGTGYTAKVRGILGDGGGGKRSSGYRRFQVTTCFQNQSECEHFLDRIHHKISQIELVRYARSKPQ